MRLRKIKNPHLYDDFIRRQRGGTVVFAGKPWTPPTRGGFLSLMSGMVPGLVKRLIPSMASKVLPAVGKRIVKEMAPKVLSSALSTGAEAIATRNPKQALRNMLKRNQQALLNQGKSIIKEEAIRAFTGRKKRGGRRVKRMKHKILKPKSSNTIFDTI